MYIFLVISVFVMNLHTFSTLFMLTISFTTIQSAVVHSHSHTNKEREKDGAYSPRDQAHYDDEGEHYSEFDHEAILGSHKEADEYDHLPPEESKRRLGILLTKMDLNGDKFIDRQEMKAWILRSFKMLSEEEAHERLEDIDDNGDGIITWTEYVADTYGLDSDELHHIDDNRLNYLNGEDVERSEVGRKALVAEDKIMWKAADKNGDNKLQFDEWVLFSNPEEHPEMLPVILQQSLNEKDKDKDGGISFQEFLGPRGVELNKEALQVEKEKFDHEYDKNKDGKLVGSEILSWIVPSNEEIAEEEVDHLFAHSDDDHDNVLSFQEVLDHHETFVGSEATDYGDHLHNIHQFQDEL